MLDEWVKRFLIQVSFFVWWDNSCINSYSPYSHLILTFLSHKIIPKLIIGDDSSCPIQQSNSLPSFELTGNNRVYLTFPKVQFVVWISIVPTSTLILIIPFGLCNNNSLRLCRLTRIQHSYFPNKSLWI